MQKAKKYIKSRKKQRKIWWFKKNELFGKPLKSGTKVQLFYDICK